MTEEQYWDKDCLLVKYFREAEELRIQKANQQAWLQGKYIYDALACVSPIFRSFSKKGTKATPYLEEAYPIGKEAIKMAEEKKKKQTYDKAKLYMETYMANYNKKFKK